MADVTLQELAQLVAGHIVGDPSLIVRDALPIQDARLNCLTLADSKQQILKAEASPAIAIVVNQPELSCKKAQIVVENIHEAFMKIIALLRPESAHFRPFGSCDGLISEHANIDGSSKTGIDTSISSGVNIAANCTIGNRCRVHPNVVLMEGCRVGDDCEIFPGVVLYPGTIIGNRVVLHANVVLGSYGFGYRQQDGRHNRTAQLGWVEIDDEVEIGAGTTVDRGTYGATRIGNGTKIDNLVQIGHNCHIGRHNLICAQVGVAGSCATGDYVVMGGQAGLKDHLTIGDGAMLAARSGLMYDVAPGEVVFGSPAGPRKDKLREHLLIGKLPEFKKELQQLSRQMGEIVAKMSSPAAVNPASPEDSQHKAA